MPLLEKGLVHDEHWLTAADFLTAIAMGMVTPGPIMTTATFAEYLVADPLGSFVYAAAMGAILATTVTLGTRAIGDWITASITIAGLAGLFRLNLRGPLRVGAASTIGLITFLIRPS